MKNLIVGQMESNGEIQDAITSVATKSNITIAAMDKPVSGEAVVKSSGFKKESTAVEKHTFDTLTDRWIPLGMYTWKKSAVPGSKLKFTEKDTEYDCVNLPQFLFEYRQDAPNMQILLSHFLHRIGNLVIYGVMNSSPRQIGAVVASWRYGLDVQSRSVDNVYSAFQRNHAIIQAGLSNNFVLNIPYHNVNSFMSNKTFNDSIMGILD